MPKTGATQPWKHNGGAPKGTIRLPYTGKEFRQFKKFMHNSKKLRCQELSSMTGTKQCIRAAATVIKFHGQMHEPMAFCGKCLGGYNYFAEAGCHPGEHVHYDVIKELAQLALPLGAPQQPHNEAQRG